MAGTHFTGGWIRSQTVSRYTDWTTGPTWKPMYIFGNISRSYLLRARNVSDKVHNITNFMFGNPPSSPRHLIFWDNVEKCCTAGQATNDNRIQLMRVSCSTPTAKNTHLEYVIIIATSCQQCVHERVSMLRYTFITSPVSLLFDKYVTYWEETRENWKMRTFLICTA